MSMSSPLNAQELQRIAPSVPRGLTVFDLILPPQAVPLLLLILLVSPLVVLTAESLLLPLWEWIKSALTLGSDSTYTGLPILFFIKLVTFLILAFFGAVQLFYRLNTTYYTVWSRAFPRPHPLHVDYQPNPNQSIISLMGWCLYRTGTILLPPVGMATITVLVGLLEFYLFNLLSELPFISLSFQFTIQLFILLMLGMFTFFAILYSLWNVFTTMFGDIIAVTEPDLPNRTILERCSRVAFSSPSIWALIPAYALFGIVILAEVILLVILADIQDITAFRANFGAILGIEVLTLGLYLLVHYFKFYTYHHSLAVYYHKLPPQLKECFSPPPPTH